MIKEKIRILETRESPLKYIKYKEDDNSSHLSKSKVPLQKEYEYYICDYCDKEIILSAKNNERDGGTVELPKSLTKTNSVIKLALHDRCLNKVLNEFKN